MCNSWAWLRLGLPCLWMVTSWLDPSRPAHGLSLFTAAASAADPSAAAWEGLASCYQNLGRFTAALKAYTRALELQPERPYSRIQVGLGHTERLVHTEQPCCQRAAMLAGMQGSTAVL